jgi:hypothetical protein
MENELKNNLLMFYFSQVYYNNEEQILQIKKLNENEIEKKYNFINYLKLK